ncbi:hypothetical protein FWK35_00036071 [Aphis craccivora]|uniref:Uncharacterized protein n=1 Tax=Aphis craccivora TaxID=307492 RepID=A0A6G0YTG8_APHCR|nr:hypothetical protein FWK35_00036071 [Aphis craccivora]
MQKFEQLINYTFNVVNRNNKTKLDFVYLLNSYDIIMVCEVKKINFPLRKPDSNKIKYQKR